MKIVSSALGLCVVSAALLWPVACCADAGAAANVVVIEPGPEALAQLQEALIVAKPGTVVEVKAGRYECKTTLSCSVDDITLRGEGKDKTVFSFANQTQGGEGVQATGDGFCIQDLAIEDTPGDGFKVVGAARVAMRGLRVEWTRGPRTDNGGYGVYPIRCHHVLVEGCVVVGGSDSGIYVGQSEDIVVRDNEVYHNVVGIEIENSRRADVYRNYAHDNSAGIMVFDLPSTPKRNGGHVRVFENRCEQNNLDNFAPPGNIVAIVPSGTGMMVMANDSVELFNNSFKDHRTVHLTINSYRLTGIATEAGAQAKWDEAYEPDCEAVFVHDNEFGAGGTDPQGSLGKYLVGLVGAPLPAIVFDGSVDPRKLVDGVLPTELGVYLKDNVGADFIDLQLSAGGKPVRDATARLGSLPPLAPVQLAEGVE